MKTIDLSLSLFQLVTHHPEIKDILFDLGFKDIIRPGMLQTAGRIMTIRKGASMKKIAMEDIIQVFINKGFEVKEESQ